MRYISLIIIIAITCLSCGSNNFDFNEELQEFKAEDTYFGNLLVKAIDDSTCFQIIRKNGKHKVLNMQNLNDYLIINCNTNDTLPSLVLDRNTAYIIEHRCILDAAPDEITIYVDSNYKLHKIGNISN